VSGRPRWRGRARARNSRVLVVRRVTKGAAGGLPVGRRVRRVEELRHDDAVARNGRHGLAQADERAHEPARRGGRGGERGQRVASVSAARECGHDQARARRSTRVMALSRTTGTEKAVVLAVAAAAVASECVISTFVMPTASAQARAATTASAHESDARTAAYRRLSGSVKLPFPQYGSSIRRPRPRPRPAQSTRACAVAQRSISSHTGTLACTKMPSRRICG
jgi:hypothetical protein